MSTTARKIGQIIVLTIIGVVFSAIVTCIGGYIFGSMFAGKLSKWDPVGMLMILGIPSGFSGFLSGLAISISKCRAVFGAMIGFFFHFFVMLVPFVVLGGASNLIKAFIETGPGATAVALGILLCGGLTGLLLSIFNKQIDRWMV